MTQDGRPLSLPPSFSFWLFCVWFFLCLGLYFHQIPLRLADDIHGLFSSLEPAKLNFSQMLSIHLSHLGTILCSFLYLVLFLGTGDRFISLSANFDLTKLERWTWSLALGFLFWGLLAEALAFTGLFIPNLMKLLAVLVLLLLLLKERTLLFRRIWPFEETPVFTWPWLALSAFFGSLTLANLLAPEMSWDAITYQLVLPRYYLEHYGFYAVTGIVPAHSPSLGQMFFSWGLIWENDSIARFFCFFAHLATALTLIGIGARMGSEKAGWWAAAFYGFFPYLNIYSTRGYVDLFAGLYAVLGLGTLLWVLEEKTKKDLSGVFALSATALGTVWGLKYNAVVYGLTALGLWYWKSFRRGAGFVLLLVLLPIFFGMPWALKSWFYTNNPLFPYLTGWFHTFGWNEFDHLASSIKFPVEGFKGLLHLPMILFGIFFHNYSGAPNEEVGLALLVFAPFALLSGRPTPKRLIWVLAVPFLFWLITSHQLRLISPVIAFTALWIGFGFERTLVDWGKRGRVLVFLSLFLCFMSGLYLFQGLLEQPNPYPHFLGFQTREQFLSLIMRPQGYVEVKTYLNQALPERSKVLILGQQNGYYLDRESIYDFDYGHALLKEWADEAKSAEELYGKFRENNVDYLLYNSNGMMGQVIRLEELGLDRYFWSPVQLKNYEQFFLKYTQKVPLPLASGYSLYRVGPRAGFSSMPEYLPGTEKYYLDEMAQLMGLKKTTQILGKNIPSEVYVKAYDAITLHYSEIGYPCFQSALADLSAGTASATQVLAKAKMGLARNGDEATWLVLQGDVLLQQGKFRAAVPYLEKAEALSPERDDVARNLAVAYYNEHRLDKALQAAQQAVQAAPFSEDDQKILTQLQSLPKRR